MKTIKQNGRVTEVYLTSEEYKAYKVVQLGREFGFSPKDIKRELKSKGLNKSGLMLIGLKAVRYGKHGADIYQSGGPTVRTGMYFAKPTQSRRISGGTGMSMKTAQKIDWSSLRTIQS